VAGISSVPSLAFSLQVSARLFVSMMVELLRAPTRWNADFARILNEAPGAVDAETRKLIIHKF
jgi:hypothetical protein